MKQIWPLVAFLGCMVNFLLVMGTKRLCGHNPSWSKGLLAGLIGGMHAGICLLPGFSFLGQIHWRLIILLVTVLIAFGWDGEGLRMGALFVLLHLAVGKIAIGEIWLFLLAVAAICLLCALGLRTSVNSNEYAKVRITHGGQTVTLNALVDSGNTLLDPISGRAVVVVGDEVAGVLLNLDRKALESPLETFTASFSPGLRLIPYHSVGQPSGVLLGLRVDELRINGKAVDQIVAFAPQKIGGGTGFQALTGGYV